MINPDEGAKVAQTLPDPPVPARMSYAIRTRKQDPREARVVLRMANGDTFDVTEWMPTVPAFVIAGDLDKLRTL